MRHEKDQRPPRYNRLYLDKKNGKISGVCAGLADYFGIDPFITRLFTVFAFIFNAPMVILGYIILAWMLSTKPGNMFKDERQNEFWKGVRTRPRNTIRDIRHKFREIERRLRAAETRVTSKEYNLHREFRDLEDT